MSFKSGKQRNFLFALDADKAKGINPPVGQHAPLNPMSPQVPLSPLHPMINTALPINPAMHAPKTPGLNPVAVPPLPGLAKLPKFGKIRNSLKGQFRGIK